MEPTPEIVAPGIADDSNKRIEFLAKHQLQTAPWIVGDVVELDDLRDYRALEDTLIDYIPHTDLAENMWLGRKPIEQILTPKKFYGRICDISLVFTDQPYEYVRVSDYKLTANALADTTLTPGFSLGFVMHAALNSTKGGNIGTLDTFVAYAYQCIDKHPNGRYYFKNPSTSAGACGIRRAVCKPVVTTDTPLLELRQASIQKAIQVHAWALKHLYGGAIESKRKN